MHLIKHFKYDYPVFTSSLSACGDLTDDMDFVKCFNSCAFVGDILNFFGTSIGLQNDFSAMMQQKYYNTCLEVILSISVGVSESKCF